MVTEVESNYNSEVLTTLIQSPLHRAECLAVVDEIIDGMDDKGILELMQGSDGDLDWVLDNILKDTYQVLYTGNPNIDFAPKYTDRLSQSIEEIFRCKNLTYFITSVLPDFQLSWHHLEWGDLVQRHNKLCIEAARDHGTGGDRPAGSGQRRARNGHLRQDHRQRVRIL